MSETFIYKNYSIVASLNERSIYLKIIDTINFLSYEGNVDLKELRVSIDLDGAYKIIINCFTHFRIEDAKSNGSNPVISAPERGILNEKWCKEESNYSVTISVNSSVLKLAFNALIGGFLKMNFEVLLREKLMSNDGQMTLNFNKLEQKQAQAIDALTKKCTDLEASVNKMKQIIDCCQIFMSDIYTHQGHWCDLQSNGQTYLNNISAKEITMTDHGHTIWKNIKVFYQLEKLTITSFNPGNNISNLSNFSNSNLTELILNCVAGHPSFASLEGIQNFPNLEILTITSAHGLKDVVTTLKNIKHKIKTLKFQTCTAVNVVELQTYCQVNNVFLALS